MTAVFTDLDGTLLDHDTYSFDEAKPALALLAERGIPCVFVTSKTRAEVERVRERVGNRDPFVVENGGAAYFPEPDGSYSRVEFGARYAELIAALDRASAESGCRVSAFHALSAREVAGLCGMTVAEARLAKLREYDEPFQVLDSGRELELLAAIERMGLRWTKGGRFHHVFRGNDKGRAVAAVIEAYQRRYGVVRTIGLGDSPNDASFLEMMTVAVVVRNPKGPGVTLQRDGVIRTEEAGPRGWNRAILQLAG